MLAALHFTDNSGFILKKTAENYPQTTMTDDNQIINKTRDKRGEPNK